MDYEEILNYEFESPDFEQTVTIKLYLRELLVTLWREREGFSGKRPFGNSGWEYDLYKVLIECGAIEGTLEDGFVEVVNTNEADQLILKLIDHCFGV